MALLPSFCFSAALLFELVSMLGLSRKIWSGEKIGPAGLILATKSGPAGPKMTPKFVRANQNWSGHITP